MIKDETNAQGLNLGRIGRAAQLGRMHARGAVLTALVLLGGCFDDGNDGSSQNVAPSAVTAPATTQENRAPTITGTPAASAVVNSAYQFTPQANDADANPLTFSISNAPAWATFDTDTGTLAGTPGSNAAGTAANIVISVSDGILITSLPAFSIQVTAATTTPPNPTGNRAPVISGVPAANATVGTAYSFTPGASDPDGNALTFSIANKPAWAAFNTSTGRLSGTPTAAATFSNIRITVSDGTLATSLPAFRIVVSAVANRAPVISGSPTTTVAAGMAYNFQPTASDADGNALGFSITNKPAWATFSTSTGRLSGTPASAASHSGIIISVSDGRTSTSLPAFTLTVTAAANRAPVITGTPATSVAVGTAYSFTPVATDADGNTLTFSIANKPAWAAFNTATGRLSGTPAAGDVGSFSGIVISVSDGTTSTSMPAFAMTVTQVATGNATLSWQAPTENTDGTPLTNLTGFRIYYGTSAGSLTQMVEISNASISSYVLGNLSPATWFFAIRAVANGTESDLSNVASKTIT